MFNQKVLINPSNSTQVCSEVTNANKNDDERDQSNWSWECWENNLSEGEDGDFEEERNKFKDIERTKKFYLKRKEGSDEATCCIELEDVFLERTAEEEDSEDEEEIIQVVWYEGGSDGDDEAEKLVRIVEAVTKKKSNSKFTLSLGDDEDGSSEDVDSEGDETGGRFLEVKDSLEVMGASSRSLRSQGRWSEEDEQVSSVWCENDQGWMESLEMEVGRLKRETEQEIVLGILEEGALGNINVSEVATCLGNLVNKISDEMEKSKKVSFHNVDTPSSTSIRNQGFTCTKGTSEEALAVYHRLTASSHISEKKVSFLPRNDSMANNSSHVAPERQKKASAEEIDEMKTEKNKCKKVSFHDLVKDSSDCQVSIKCKNRIDSVSENNLNQLKKPILSTMSSRLKLDISSELNDKSIKKIPFHSQLSLDSNFCYDDVAELSNISNSSNMELVQNESKEGDMLTDDKGDSENENGGNSPFKKGIKITQNKKLSTSEKSINWEKKLFYLNTADASSPSTHTTDSYISSSGSIDEVTGGEGNYDQIRLSTDEKGEDDLKEISSSLEKLSLIHDCTNSSVNVEIEGNPSNSSNDALPENRKNEVIEPNSGSMDAFIEKGDENEHKEKANIQTNYCCVISKEPCVSGTGTSQENTNKTAKSKSDIEANPKIKSVESNVNHFSNSALTTDLETKSNSSIPKCSDNVVLNKVEETIKNELHVAGSAEGNTISVEGHNINSEARFQTLPEISLQSSSQDNQVVEEIGHTSHPLPEDFNPESINSFEKMGGEVLHENIEPSSKQKECTNSGCFNKGDIKLNNTEQEVKTSSSGNISTPHLLEEEEERNSTIRADAVNGSDIENVSLELEIPQKEDFEGDKQGLPSNMERASQNTDKIINFDESLPSSDTQNNDAKAECEDGFNCEINQFEVKSNSTEGTGLEKDKPGHSTDWESELQNNGTVRSLDENYAPLSTNVTQSKKESEGYEKDVNSEITENNLTCQESSSFTYIKGMLYEALNKSLGWCQEKSLTLEMEDVSLKKVVSSGDSAEAVRVLGGMKDNFRSLYNQYKGVFRVESYLSGVSMAIDEPRSFQSESLSSVEEYESAESDSSDIIVNCFTVSDPIVSFVLNKYIFLQSPLQYNIMSLFNPNCPKLTNLLKGSNISTDTGEKKEIQVIDGTSVENKINFKHNLCSINEGNKTEQKQIVKVTEEEGEFVFGTKTIRCLLQMCTDGKKTWLEPFYITYYL